jgi:gluconolactonase
MKYKEKTAASPVFFANRQLVQRQHSVTAIRLITCEHSVTCRVVRTEKNGKLNTVLADSFEGKNSTPEDILVKKSDDSIWFT